MKHGTDSKKSGSESSVDVQEALSFKKKFGVILCLIYGFVYCGFIGVAVYNVELMDLQMLFGLNLAAFYGIGLILFALVLALIYSTICNAVERRTTSVPSEPIHVIPLVTEE